MKRLALLVGVDDYPDAPLAGCVRDAHAMERLLARHDDGDPNFECRRLTSDEVSLSSPERLLDELRQLFSRRDVELALFYFAGHGVLREGLGGRLLTGGVRGDRRGLRMDDLVSLANGSAARERLIILDCCHAGAISDDHRQRHEQPTSIERGVALLAGCGRSEAAAESGGQGKFTGHVCDALEGGAADVRGHVTVGGVYAYLNEVLTGWEQQPAFHANLTQFSVLRRAAAAVTDEKLRRLVEYFAEPEALMHLDPSFEFSAKPPHEDNEATFSRLQQLRAARLIEPVGTEHMYYAAMERKACRLTPLGKFYWRAVAAGQI